MNVHTPYWRLSAVYLWYFAVVGALSPYWALYLEHLGYSPKAIGFIVAIPMITRILAPNIWGWIAERTKATLGVVIIGSLGAWVCFIGVLVRSDFWGLVCFIALFSFFWNAIIAQLEVLTLRFLDDTPQLYGRVRLWGSVGFILIVVSLGAALDYFPISILPWCIFVFLVCIWLTCCTLPKIKTVDHHCDGSSFYSCLKKPQVILFLIVVFLVQSSLGMYHAFYSLYLEQYGYTRSQIGVLWSLGAGAEIILFLYLPKLFLRFSSTMLLNIVLVVTLIRWLIIDAGANYIVLIALAQLGHAFTFGLCHGLAVEFIRKQFKGSAQSQGQALYSAFGFGAASAFGSVLAGYVFSWDYTLVFKIAALITIVALFLQALSYYLVRDQ